MKEDFGVVIIARDEERNIGTCLASLKEAGINTIMVIIDSRTGDKTAEVAQKYTPRIEVVDGNRGRLRNTGYRKLGLPYAAFVDADMQVTSGYLESLRKAMDEDPKLAIVGGEQKPFDCCFLGSLDCEYVNYKRAIPAGGSMYRAEALESVGGFQDKLNVGEDGELLSRLLENGWHKKWVGDAVIGHRYATNYRVWHNKMSHGAAAGFHAHGVLRLLASPVIGVHAAWVRSQPHMLWYLPLRSLVLLFGAGERQEYNPLTN